MPDCFYQQLYDCYLCQDASQKANMVRQFYCDYCDDRLHINVEKATEYTFPDIAGRPEKPELVAPAQVKKRKINKNKAGRAALLHALAHIEFNAINLSLDMVARFGYPNQSLDFISDWLKIADDEAKHFLLLNQRLSELDSFYGAMPAHAGLWESAINTKDHYLARLAIIPLVLEARGLDVVPEMIAKFTNIDDAETAAILQIIHDDEVTHVATGKKYFDLECEKNHIDNKVTYWQELVMEYFKGVLKPPFNIKSRDLAKFSREYYEPIAVY